jgi:hypothetical protein
MLSDRSMPETARRIRSIDPGAAVRLIGIGLGVLAWTVLIRLPFLDSSGPDDGFFTEVALLWRHGVIPYVGVFDVKPPGFFAVLALAQAALGPSLAALHVIGVLSDAATMALMLQMTARRGAPAVGLFAALLYGWFSHAVVGDDCYSLLIALTTLAMAVGLSRLPIGPRAIAAGLVIGAAAMVKQTAVLEALALAMILAGQAAQRRWRIAALFAASAAVVPFVVVCYFAAHGAVGALLHDIVGVALQRPGSNTDRISFLNGIVRFGLIARGIAPILLIAAITAALQRRAPRWRAEIQAISLWFALALVGVFVQHALLATYLGPLMPPALLLSGYGLALRLGNMRSAVAVGLAGFALIEATVAVRATLIATLDARTALDRATAAIAAAGPKPDDRLYVIKAGADAEWLYPMTGVLPATPFLIPSQSACDFPDVGLARITEAFAARPRFVVTDASGRQYECAVAAANVPVDNGLKAYRLLAAVMGDDRTTYNVYEIASP